MAAPALSVVIPHYGDPEPTALLIEQLKAQKHAGPLQVIIADDCSPEPFPPGDGYEVVRRDTNGGFGSAVNTGVAVARHPMVMVLNSDVELSATFVSELLAHAGQHPPSLLGPRVVEAGVPKVSAWRWPRVLGIVAEWLQPLARWHGAAWLDRFWGADLRAHNAAADTKVEWLVGVCLLLPTSAFRQVGGFDERFFMNCEEIDLQRRLASAGVHSIYVPGVELRHAGGGSSDPSRKSGWLVDARFKYHAKWGGAAGLLVGLTAASVVNLGYNAGRRVLGKEVHPLRSFRRELALVLHGWNARSAP
ncbi:glycosyltransferase family 2 protein [Propionibacteriaceae bacterium Y1923]|uniref:glycosyltransferase family 2 protein n=1 Tax=Aestuariimicrobium sp. Y1814 TaxID=3418742 RepID=UPI003C2360B2